MPEPKREHILVVLNERDAGTVEIGDEIGLDVTAFMLDDVVASFEIQRSVGLNLGTGVGQLSRPS